MSDPVRAEVARAELDALGLKHFLDVRATARRVLEDVGPARRVAFAAAVTERLLKEDERLPASERPAYLASWRPVADAVWRHLSGDPAALGEIAAAVGRFYLSPEYRSRRHDDPTDGGDHPVMAAFYTAECCLHGCLDFALWAGWRGFDGASVRAAGDSTWPHRRPVGMSSYAWELSHPGVQTELDRQLTDLELVADRGAHLDQVADHTMVLVDLLGHLRHG
jgi:hypothetical protein